MTQVINLRTYTGNDFILIDRRTPYGNPFPINAKTTRADSIRKFREWLDEWVIYGKEVIIRGRSNKWIIEHLGDLREGKLACWCDPLPCHGHIYVEILEKV